jgi:hypothetical protein
MKFAISLLNNRSLKWIVDLLIIILLTFLLGRIRKCQRMIFILFLRNTYIINILSGWSSKLPSVRRHTSSIFLINRPLMISKIQSTTSSNLCHPDIPFPILIKMETKSLFKTNKTIIFWSPLTLKLQKSTSRKLMNNSWNWLRKFKLRNRSVKLEKKSRTSRFKNPNKKLKSEMSQLFLKLIKV